LRILVLGELEEGKEEEVGLRGGGRRWGSGERGDRLAPFGVG